MELNIETTPVNRELMVKITNIYITCAIICVFVILILLLSLYRLHKTLKFISIGAILVVIGLFIWGRNIVASYDWWYGMETVIYPIKNYDDTSVF